MYGLKVPVRYRFQLKKQLLVGCREQLRKKDTEFDSSITLDEKYEIKNIIIVLKCKKMFLFEKFDKNIQFNSCWCKTRDFFI